MGARRDENIPSLWLALFAAACSAEASSLREADDSTTVPCSTRTLSRPDGSCVCPEDDVLCPTRGYTHFTISNVENSGLPNEATYDVTEHWIRDRVTSLVWERVPSSEYFGWQEARARCAALELAGRSDFRLPGRIELVTILDFGRVPVIAAPFDIVRSDYHWTSTPAAFVAGSAYSVYFGAGETTIARANPGRALVRCVAGPVATLSGPQFEVQGDRVLDRVTKLAWERAVAPDASWDAANERCASLGMRLPSVRELQSIVDENRHMPAADPEVFPDVPPVGFWSSTWRGSDPWYVDFLDGKTFADRPASEALPSRCVSP